MSETDLGSCPTPMLELFVKIVNDLIDVCQGPKYVVTYESWILSSLIPLGITLNRSSPVCCLVFVLHKKNYYEHIFVCSLHSNFKKDGYFSWLILLAMGVLGVPEAGKWGWEAQRFFDLGSWLLQKLQRCKDETLITHLSAF